MEDLDTNIRRFHDRALDCYDHIEQKMLVDICLCGMIEDYHIFLEILPFDPSPS